MCFVNLEKEIDRVPRKGMGWAMKKKGTPEVLVRAISEPIYRFKDKNENVKNNY